MLELLSRQSALNLWLIFAVENILVTSLALLAGWIVLKLSRKPINPATGQEWAMCLITNIINTAVTYAGFYFWKSNHIIFLIDFNWRIITDTLMLLLGMDLAMYVFHFTIHHSVAYKAIHHFHHRYSSPIPIDLFVLHPLETISFGALWLLFIWGFTFNFYAVLIYLMLNVVFGVAGHLGIEPVPDRVRHSLLMKYFGTSTFHHNHHSDINFIFGFYTNIWDRIFRTYKD